MEKCGTPWRKLVVPSSGSTIQRGLSGLPSISPLSSSSIPQSGRALRSSSTIVCSARLSAIETKSAGPLRLTCSCSTSPKSRLKRGAALRAARVMTVIRPEWATIYPLPRAGEGGAAKRRRVRVCLGEGKDPHPSPLPIAGEGASIRPPHIFPVVHIDDDLRPRGDVRRDEHLHAIVEDR